jgi:hypothetical protein
LGKGNRDSTSGYYEPPPQSNNTSVQSEQANSGANSAWVMHKPVDSSQAYGASGTDSIDRRLQNGLQGDKPSSTPQATSQLESGALTGEQVNPGHPLAGQNGPNHSVDKDPEEDAISSGMDDIPEHMLAAVVFEHQNEALSRTDTKSPSRTSNPVRNDKYVDESSRGFAKNSADFSDPGIEHSQSKKLIATKKVELFGQKPNLLSRRHKEENRASKSASVTAKGNQAAIPDLYFANLQHYLNWAMTAWPQSKEARYMNWDPKKKFQSMKDAEDAVKSLATAYVNAKRDHDDTIKDRNSLQKAKDDEISDLRYQLGKKVQEIKKINSDHEETIKSLKRMNKELDDTKRKTNAFTTERRNLEDKIRKVETESHQLDLDYRRAQSSIHEYQRQLDVARRNNDLLDGKLTDANQKIGSTIRECESKLSSSRFEWEKRAADYQNTISKMRNTHEDEKEQLRQQMLDQFEQEKSKSIQEQKSKITSLETDHKNQIQILTSKMEGKMKDLSIKLRKMKKENELLRGEMMNSNARGDDIPVISDRDLESLFKDFSLEIDGIARVTKWDTTKERTWPVRETILRNTENDTRTKRYLVQNSIWAILYEFIFNSPFAALGTVGDSMEEEWCDLFNAGEVNH